MHAVPRPDDLSARKLLYRKELASDPLSSYVHLPVAVSPTLGGRHIYVMDISVSTR